LYDGFFASDIQEAPWRGGVRPNTEAKPRSSTGLNGETTMSKKLHIGCSPLKNTIYAGTLLKDGRTWGANKQDVTIEALEAVAEHVVRFGAPVEISDETGKMLYRITVEKMA